MRPAYITDKFLRDFIQAALAEDVGDGDHSTLAVIPPDEQKSARLIIKDSGILAGVDLARQIFGHVDKSIGMEIFLHDGDTIKPGDIAFTVAGSAR
ncbi:MAG: nicotinate-nucleotide diphosphorylase (carboxylating), partial [Bacteroidota bacterium]|nr:nicotinate-nucleotide diphosphorylase (carboxylating) [Bacteroidota bacterium]